MPFDPNRNIHLLGDIDVPLEWKLVMGEQVSRMMEGAVDRAFGVDSVQTCLGIKTKKPTRPFPHRLDSMDPITPIFNDAAKRSAARKRRR